MDILKNDELGLNLNYWNGKNKNERVFLSKQIMEQLGYKGGNKTLVNHELEEGLDKVTLTKKKHPKFFKQLTHSKLLGARAGSTIMLYESGVWKLIMGSKKQIGINTRNWLAREVLPTLKSKGSYSIKESEQSPFSYLNKFTETKKQLEGSKAVAEFAKANSLNYSATYNQIHKLVTGLTAKEIKSNFGSKGSAREVLRQNFPHLAATESVIDFLVTSSQSTLANIEQSGAHKTLPPAFESLYKLGINFSE